MNITTTDARETLTENIRRLLAMRGHGEKSLLAAALGVSSARVTELISGKHSMRVDAVQKIADHFEVDVPSLFTPFDEIDFSE